MEHLTLAETAQWLRVSRWTVHRLIKDGELTKVEVRGGVRVTRASVDDYLARHTVRALNRSTA